MQAVCLGFLACCGFAVAQEPRQVPDSVRSIFVDTLGQGEWPTIIRDKIINRLAASGRFQVVLDPEKADAILTGSVAESKTIEFSEGSGGTRYDATAVVRLVDSAQEILWISESKNNRFARSASSSVADHIVKDLLKASAPPKKKQGKPPAPPRRSRLVERACCQVGFHRFQPTSAARR